MKFFLNSLKTLILLFPFFSSSFVSPGDNDYLILEEDQYRIIFDRQYLNSIDTINQKIKLQMERMSKFKNRSLDRPLTVILFSSKNQVSNAFATVFPSFIIGMYPTGILGLDRLSLPFWFDDVFRHELNHVFQMSHSKYPKALKNFFLPSLLFFYIYSPYPNILLPSFVLEGDSVLKESLFHYGGRLYSGYARALVYSQIKHYQYQIPQFTKNNLFNLRMKPHSGSEKYLHGGYLMAMLAETYSNETVNSFFKVDKKTLSRKIRKQIKETPVKEKLSSTFAKHFSFKHTLLFLEDMGQAYFNHWLKEASLQRSSPEPALFESHACPEFGRKGDEVLFLSSDFKSVPTLRIFNKKTRKWTKKKSDLPLGKVFKIGETYYARSSQTVKPHVIHYSLFSEGLRPNKKFESQYVQDLQNNKTLYIDPKNNLDSFKLYLNDSFYSKVHSNALFDRKGNIYFFKQKGEIRTLYKNKQPLFSYPGYYGNLLDIGEDGTIYFNGASPYGSSVYQYKKGEISRTVSSDTVIQAKKINDKELIACEITPYSYAYKIIPIELSHEKPVLYKYSFKGKKISKNNSKTASEDSFKLSNSETTNIKRQINSAKQIKQEQKNKTSPLKYKEYSSLRNLKYKGTSLTGLTTGWFHLLGAGVLFSDYLQKQNILLSYNTALLPQFKTSLHLGGLNYINRIFPLEWNLGYRTLYYRGIAYHDTEQTSNSPAKTETEVEHFLEHIGYLQLNYPLFKKGRWFSSVSSLKALQFLESGKETLWRGQINFGYSQVFPYAYSANKASTFSLFFDHRYHFDEKWNALKSGAIWDVIFRLGKDFYVFPSLSYARSFNPEFNPASILLYEASSFKASDYYESSFHSSDPRISRFEDTGSTNFIMNDIYSPLFKSRYKAESIAAISLGFKKPFDMSLLGGTLNRLVPLGRVRWLILENMSSSDFVTVDDKIFKETSIADKDTFLQKVQDNAKLAQEKKEKKNIKFQKYVQWLEWTGGIESEFIVLNRARLILGFSMGIRTPLKFWENRKKKKDNKIIKEGSIGGVLESSVTKAYLKMPL